ncbi:3-oxo-glucose-6-phosphate--glutamate aminotransferase [Streptomyces sp. WAC 01529]|nr:3-oxo-glucose-6-phosphate--glutamate aminotransferase [Streptomyces sp. WAC 01529]
MEKDQAAVAGRTLTGDSASIHELAQGVLDGVPLRFRVRETLANQELAKTLEALRHSESDTSVLRTLFPGSLDTTGVAFLPKDRLLSPEEKSAAATAFAGVLDSGDFTSGPAVDSFEGALSEFLGAAHTVATGSGTDALIIALRAVGVGPGDQVILPANSFAATENAVFACGAEPVLADVTLPDGNLDPASVEEHITARTAAILPVHLYGRLADMAGLRAVADRHRLGLVEDACQAIGVTGVGQYSDAAVLSFNPYKNFGLCGKSGAVVTGSAEIAERCRVLSYHGFVPGQKNIKCETFGLNSRIDNTMAAIGLALLPWLSLRALRRTCLAKRYIDALSPLARQLPLDVPTFVPDHAWHLFPLVFHEDGLRDTVRTRVSRSSGVETDVYYPVLTHQHETPLREKLFGGVSLPRTEQLNAHVLHLPLHAGMSLGEQDRVIDALHDALRAQT